MKLDQILRRGLSLFLAALAAAAMYGCSKPSVTPGGNTTQPGTDSTQAAETETGRASAKDNLPADLDFGGTTLNVVYFGMDDAHYYDAVGESGGDVVYDAVYMRNISVSDRLNININWIRGPGSSTDWESYPAQIDKVLLSGSPDYDIVFEENSRLFKQSLEGYFIDLKNAEYLGYSQPWWYDSLMDEASIDTSRRYFVTGDFALTTLLGASAIYFNKDIYTNFFGDASALYQTVQDGKWTADVFMDLCRRVYGDINGDGAADAGDLFGFRFVQWGVPNYLSMSTGLTYSSRDDEGLPVLELNTEAAVKWADKLYAMLYRDNMSILCKDNAEMNAIFHNGLSLFFVGMLGDAPKMRDSAFGYGIIPHPKLDESLDYLCAAGTVNGEGAAIPVSVPDDRAEAGCALLEALGAQSYRTVVPAWYDTALKVKYVEAEIDAEMIDLIYDHVGTSFIMMADKTLSIGSIFTYAVYGSSSGGAYTTYYAKNESSINSNFTKMIEKYKSLGA